MKYIDDNFMKGRLDKLREKLRKSSDGISASSPSEKALMSESKDVRMLIEQCEKYNAQVELLVHSRIYELEARAIALSKTPFLDGHETKQWHDILGMLNSAFQPLPDCTFKTELSLLTQSIQSYKYENVPAQISDLKQNADAFLNNLKNELSGIAEPHGYNKILTYDKITHEIQIIKNKLMPHGQAARNAIDGWIVQLRDLTKFLNVLQQDEKNHILDVYDHSLKIISEFAKNSRPDTKFETHFKRIKSDIDYHVAHNLHDLKSSAKVKSNDAMVKKLLQENLDLREQLQILRSEHTQESFLINTVEANQKLINEQSDFIADLTAKFQEFTSTSATLPSAVPAAAPAAAPERPAASVPAAAHEPASTSEHPAASERPAASEHPAAPDAASA